MKTFKSILCCFIFLMVFSATTLQSQNIMLTNKKLDFIKERISKKRGPTQSAFNNLEKFVKDHQNYGPNVLEHWYVPGYYDDAVGHATAKKSLQDDANTAYGFALYFNLTNDKKYGKNAIQIINAWANGVKTFSRKDDSRLSFSYHFPALVFAADLMRNSGLWSEADQRIFEKFLKEKAIPMNTSQSKNNWGNWGLVLASAGAAYLQDTTMLRQCADRWKFFIESQVAKDGHLPHEVKRGEGKSGIWYSHFCLFPQTIAAEILKNNGYDLYEYKSPGNRSLESAFHKIAFWTKNPDQFPHWNGAPEKLGGLYYFSYFEILANYWPDENATKLLEKSRPLTARHSAPFLTLTHGM
jgi:hypothetical protein